MIREIVSSDVDFAGGMMNSGHSDTDILAHLASRGLEPAQAAQLVDDLRHGRKPSIPLPFGVRPAGHSAVGRRETLREDAHHAQHSDRKRSRSGKHKHAAVPWWFVILVGIALLALGYVLLETGRRLATDGIEADKHEVPGAAGK